MFSILKNFFRTKGIDVFLIAINKPEKDIISQYLPGVHIVRTMKQKSKRHHYYCEETPDVMRLLKQIRSGEGGWLDGTSDEPRETY